MNYCDRTRDGVAPLLLQKMKAAYADVWSKGDPDGVKFRNADSELSGWSATLEREFKVLNAQHIERKGRVNNKSHQLSDTLTWVRAMSLKMDELTQARVESDHRLELQIKQLQDVVAEQTGIIRLMSQQLSAIRTTLPEVAGAAATAAVSSVSPMPPPPSSSLSSPPPSSSPAQPVAKPTPHALAAAAVAAKQRLTISKRDSTPPPQQANFDGIKAHEVFCDVVTKHRGNAPDTGQTFEGRGIMNRNQAARLRVIVKFYTAVMDAGDGAIIEGGGRDCHDMLLKLNSRIADAAGAFFEKHAPAGFKGNPVPNGFRKRGAAKRAEFGFSYFNHQVEKAKKEMKLDLMEMFTAVRVRAGQPGAAGGQPDAAGGQSDDSDGRSIGDRAFNAQFPDVKPNIGGMDDDEVKRQLRLEFHVVASKVPGKGAKYWRDKLHELWEARLSGAGAGAGASSSRSSSSVSSSSSESPSSLIGQVSAYTAGITRFLTGPSSGQSSAKRARHK